MGSNPPLSTCLGWLMIATDCRSRLCLEAGMVAGKRKEINPCKLARLPALVWVTLGNVLIGCLLLMAQGGRGHGTCSSPEVGKLTNLPALLLSFRDVL